MHPVRSPLAPSMPVPPPKVRKLDEHGRAKVVNDIDWRNEATHHIYSHMRAFAIEGQFKMCRFLAEMLVKERQERPNREMYNSLILSNVGHEEGAAWRVADLLEEMEKDELPPDTESCHAALKVLAVHPDHLLRSDIVEYMNQRWIAVNDDGAHDIVAGLLREGLFEQALNRLDTLRQDDVAVSGWLLDTAVYVLCEASEMAEAYRIMRQRHESGELISRSLWIFFLDKASEARHHGATAFAWSAQVQQQFINPSSGICLNVLATAAQAADAAMATDVFTNLEKRGTKFEPVHYELLINTYLASDPPDLHHALAILTIMALGKTEPKQSDTRALFLYMVQNPETISQAIEILRELHSQDRQIPIAALNLIIESYIARGKLQDALKLYKQIHTFAPMSAGARKTFADIETFNLLLKGCRDAEPTDVNQASFLVSELLALRIVPTELTYDRLILLFAMASKQKLAEAKTSVTDEDSANHRERGLQMIDWSYRHFTEMRPMNWLPRIGTLHALSQGLAHAGDDRCWEVLQAAEDGNIQDWKYQSVRIRKEVEEAWGNATGGDRDESRIRQAEALQQDVPGMIMHA